MFDGSVRHWVRCADDERDMLAAMSSRIKEAPSAYDGTLDEFYETWAKHVLLAPSIVEEFHTQFCVYLNSVDPVFLVRKVIGQKRGQTLRTDTGVQLRPTDNAPAWWIHHQLFSRHFLQYASFGAFVESVPCHMFQVRIPQNINKAGWHVAHIFDVNNRDFRFRGWDRNELVRRTARNIHPCNYFYVPKCEWQRHASNPTLIAFFYDKFKSIYRAIWKDFMRLVDGTPHVVPVGASECRYSFSTNQTKHRGAAPNLGGNPGAGLHGCVAQYSHSRLCFKADVIEPLGMDDRFCIVTHDGAFAMTKGEFYETFPNVLKSKSYRQNKSYHYPHPPQRAVQFKVNLG